jgi:hypothetical protein
MDTPLGRAMHEYHWAGIYYRRNLFGPAHWQVWNGVRWEDVTCPPQLEPARKEAA